MISTEMMCEVCKQQHMPETSAAKTSPRQGKRSIKPTIKKQIAFKCSYCDGGITTNNIGFMGVCSDNNLINNVSIEKKTWCSAQECHCKRYFDKKITRQELEVIYKNDNTAICYESHLLVNWSMSAGMVVRGVNKGKPNTLKGVEKNSLCVLTSRKPNSHTSERFIFSVFLVYRSDEGDDYNVGKVSAHEKYRLYLTDAEAKQMIFWDYYLNKSELAPKHWGTGLFRYLDRDAALKILQDIAQLKKGTKDEALADEFLDYFINN